MKPQVALFIGPSLPDARKGGALADAWFLPPAERGDLLRAVLRGARIVGLVDGYFEHRYSVQHKEILWALDQGVAVYGASSMGALRAAELASMGMASVGVVANAFEKGELIGDDEVALIHGPPPEYRKGSEALVNIRATLQRALGEQLILPQEMARLLEAVGAKYYPDRSFATLVDAAASTIRDPARCSLLQSFLVDQNNWVDQKRLDAERLLEQIQADISRGTLPKKKGTWAFPWTSAWAQLWDEVRLREQLLENEQLREKEQPSTNAPRAHQRR